MGIEQILLKLDFDQSAAELQTKYPHFLLQSSQARDLYDIFRRYIIRIGIFL